MPRGERFPPARFDGVRFFSRTDVEPRKPQNAASFPSRSYGSVGAEKIHNCCSGRLYHYRATIRPSQCGARLWAKSRFPKCLRILRSDSQEGTDSSLCEWVFAAAANAYCVAV